MLRQAMLCELQMDGGYDDARSIRVVDVVQPRHSATSTEKDSPYVSKFSVVR